MVNARKKSYARLLLAYSCSKHVEKGLLTVLSFAYVIGFLFVACHVQLVELAMVRDYIGIASTRTQTASQSQSSEVETYTSARI